MKRFKKIVLIVLGLLILSLIGMIFFSPYKKYENNKYRSVDFSIDINVPVDSVFTYLGNSNNAIDWSSYVDHITPLNSNEVQDGTVGSKRRCFKEANEKGIIWDEEIVEVIPNKKRRLTIYDLQGFPLQANGLQTEQIYSSLSENKMRLTFSVFFGDHNPSFMESLKMYYAAYVIHDIFKGNLINVKRIMENSKHD